jgi:hypothetical protein
MWCWKAGDLEPEEFSVVTPSLIQRMQPTSLAEMPLDPSNGFTDKIWVSMPMTHLD